MSIMIFFGCLALAGPFVLLMAIIAIGIGMYKGHKENQRR